MKYLNMWYLRNRYFRLSLSKTTLCVKVWYSFRKTLYKILLYRDFSLLFSYTFLHITCDSVTFYAVIIIKFIFLWLLSMYDFLRKFKNKKTLKRSSTVQNIRTLNFFFCYINTLVFFCLNMYFFKIFIIELTIIFKKKLC